MLCPSSAKGAAPAAASAGSSGRSTFALALSVERKRWITSQRRYMRLFTA
jgi:hypothetical protein